MGINDQFGQPQDFTTEMESVSETRLLTLFCRQRLDGLQVEVVIKMQIVQVLTVNQQVEHVVPLTADLKTNLNPIKTC